jgi:ribosomal protein S18 acetylase RimI-like enzyme
MKSAARLRRAKESDSAQILELILRLKRLNEEFDPLFKVGQEAAKVGRDYVARALNSPQSHTFVAEVDERIVGVVRVETRTRAFYTPRNEARIVDLYILPEFRRGGLGKKLVAYSWSRLKGEANLLTVEFPSSNMISANFYSKIGFRPLVNVYAKRD